MRKFVFISLWIVSFAALMGCNFIQPKYNAPIELIAFNSLTDDEKNLIPASPKDSSVEKVTVNDEIKILIDTNYKSDEVYAVIFHHTETNASGKLTVFVGLDKETVVGKGFTGKQESNQYQSARCWRCNEP